MSKILWLDDKRDPFLNLENKVPKEGGQIYWVTDYQEFVNWIIENGLPDIISFDHDLHEKHYTPEKYWNDYEASKKYQEALVYDEKTGEGCAEWLTHYCFINNKRIPKTYVHSANPVGADKINHILTQFKKRWN